MYQPIILPHFHRQIKDLAKKYRHLKAAVIRTLSNFDKREAVPLGGNVYKVRVRSADIAKGKSKSFRLLILVIGSDGYLVPIAIYFKGDQESLSKKEINTHLETILLELKRQ